MLYADIKEAFKSIAAPDQLESQPGLPAGPLHSYLKSSRDQSTRNVQVEAEETLQGYFEVTNWDVLCYGDREDIDALTKCFIDDIKF